MDTAQMHTAAPRGAGQGSVSSQLMLFAGKTLIVAVAIVVAFLIVAIHVENKMSQIAQEMQKATKLGGADFWRKIEQEVDRMADADAVPEEKKQKILKDLRAITAQWKPFVNEAYSIVTEGSGAQATPAGK